MFYFSASVLITELFWTLSFTVKFDETLFAKPKVLNRKGLQSGKCCIVTATLANDP